jgi:phosphonate transport system substrate-binding protein
MVHASTRLILAALMPGMWLLCSSVVSADPPIRIAITPVLVENYLEVNHHLIAYVGKMLGRRAEIVQRRSYKEISDLLERGEVDVAFVCGRPYVLDHQRFGLELLVAPVVYDEGPIYYSYVIVPRDSNMTRFEQLRGQRYAFSDPLSNSGHLVPLHMLAAKGESPERFFRRTIFTYSHSASVEAVAVQFVDGASVDSYVYDYLVATNPALTNWTRIIHRSPPYGITPVVVRTDLSPGIKARLRAIFLGMDRDPGGRAILAQLMIKRFESVPDGLFDGIRDMLRFVEARAPGAVIERITKP